MKYETEEISPLDLLLDTKNPRFIVKPNATEKDIIEYLLKYEEIVELANGINKNEGLLIGERIIVCKENDKYVVLEGNRRTCSCKLLLNNALIPELYKSKVVKTSEKTRSNIETIQVDIAPSRLEAKLALASKHIDGIKKWSTISKIKFYTGSFNEGKSINFIEEVTGVDKQKIVTGIKNYSLLTYALDLKNNMNLKYYDLIDIQKAKLDRFFRIFSTKSKKFNKKSTRDLLKIFFDDINYNFITLLPKDIFDECISILVEKTLLEGTINTRSEIDEVDEVIRILKLYYDNTDNVETNIKVSNIPKKALDDNHDDTTSTKEGISINDKSVGENNSTSIFNKINNNTQNNIDEPQHSSLNTKKVVYTYTKANARNFILPDYFNYKTSSTKINQMLDELNKLNINSFTISAGILLRCFLEQTSKCYADISGLTYDDNTSLQQLINGCINNMRKNNLITKEIHSCINSVIKNPDTSYITFLNGIVHQQESYPGKETLIDVFNIFEEYFKQILNKI